jgi:Do/DeqQ family serine protease
MKRFNLGLILGVTLITSFFTMASFRFFSNGKLLSFEKSNETLSEPLAIPAPLASPVGGGGIPFDFTEAAEKTTDAVVHIKTKINPKPVANRGRGSNPYQDLFGDEFFRFFGDPYGGGMMPNQPQEASGSGVIISTDGYIVTNNHVVEDADEITVTLHNNKTYTAKLIGKDKDFDLAVIKIEETKLPIVEFGNSDSVKVGQWCVAVGNPFNLTSTVTAGIISAKGRNINLLGGGNAKGGNTAIESFIQTDAAVNPGNSGGALVNLKGQLIGINTAIASNTGSYAGYSFAVPSNLVYKVYTDIKSFGAVQRGYLGVTIRSVDDALAKELKLNSVEGVYVESLVSESAAADAGIKAKDVITKINGVGIKTSPELQEQVGKYRPGDKINVEYIRDGKNLSTIVVLKNKFNNTSSVDNGKEILNQLGADFTALTPQEASKLGVKGGVKVSNIKEGKLKQYTEIQNGFIITFLNEQAISSTDDMVNAVGGKTGNITIEGIYPGKPFSFLYAFKM